MKVKCIDFDSDFLFPWETDNRIEQIENWLNENVGNKYEMWEWSKYGHIRFKKPKEVGILIFKLKFGI